MDIGTYNRKAGNRLVEVGNQWTVPVNSEASAAARRGEWRLLLNPTKPVLRNRYPES